MKGCRVQAGVEAPRARGMTLVETMLAVCISSMVLAAILMMSLFGSWSFGAMANYADLDDKSRNSLDFMSRDIREATALVGFENTGTNKWLLFTNAAGGSIKYAWDSVTRSLVCEKTGQPPATYLTGCQGWEFQLYQRTPHTNTTYMFFPATNVNGVLDPSLCKVINMSWKCSRTLVNRFNTESVQTAQVVLRNKQ